MKRFSVHYNDAYNFMVEVGREGVSKRLSQLLTFHTIYWIKCLHKTNKNALEDLSILDLIIAEELKENRSGNISNLDYDGGKEQYDIDFFHDKYIVPARKNVVIEYEKKEKEWGQEEEPEVQEVAIVKKEVVKVDTIDLVKILQYANGTQITRMLNGVARTDLTKNKPYTAVGKELGIIILNAVKPVASKEKSKLITLYLEKEGRNEFN